MVKWNITLQIVFLSIAGMLWATSLKLFYVAQKKKFQNRNPSKTNWKNTVSDSSLDGIN